MAEELRQLLKLNVKSILKILRRPYINGLNIEVDDPDGVEPNNVRRKSGLEHAQREAIEAGRHRSRGGDIRGEDRRLSAQNRHVAKSFKIDW